MVQSTYTHVKLHPTLSETELYFSLTMLIALKCWDSSSFVKSQLVSLLHINQMITCSQYATNLYSAIMLFKKQVSCFVKIFTMVDSKHHNLTAI